MISALADRVMQLLGKMIPLVNYCEPNKIMKCLFCLQLKSLPRSVSCAGACVGDVGGFCAAHGDPDAGVVIGGGGGAAAAAFGAVAAGVGGAGVLLVWCWWWFWCWSWRKCLDNGTKGNKDHLRHLHQCPLKGKSEENDQKNENENDQSMPKEELTFEDSDL